MQLPGRRLGGGGVALHAGDRYRLQAMAGQGATGGHQRNQGLLHQGQDRLHRRRSHVAEQGKVALLSDQLARVAQCQRRFVTVIAPSR